MLIKARATAANDKVSNVPGSKSSRHMFAGVGLAAVALPGVYDVRGRVCLMARQAVSGDSVMLGCMPAYPVEFGCQIRTHSASRHPNLQIRLNIFRQPRNQSFNFARTKSSKGCQPSARSTLVQRLFGAYTNQKAREVLGDRTWIDRCRLKPWTRRLASVSRAELG